MSARKPYRLQSTGNRLPDSFQSVLRSALNEEQFVAASDLQSGPQLILAGAGTGKTRTLIHKLAALVAAGHDPNSILLLTFTRKAAEQMLQRATVLIGDSARRVQGGTFHGFAHQVLRRFAPVLGLSPSFTIADASDAEDILNLLRTQSGLAGTEKRFPQKATLARIHTRHGNTGAPVVDIVAEEYPRYLDQVPDIQTLFERYRSYKHAHSIRDYDDLMGDLLCLLVEHPAVREQLQREVRQILVDEFQDTNPIQGRIVAALAGEGGAITAVGDHRQSIYAFRGADHRNILHFTTTFPASRVHHLTRNYRSTQQILDFANALMEDSAGRDAPLEASSTALGQPVLVHGPDLRGQADFVAQHLLHLREEGIPLSEVAILFRSAHHSNELEVELSRRGIPFRKFGGIRFAEAAHIKDLLCYLRVVCNPRDTIAWQRLLLLLPGVGTATAARILTALESQSPSDVLTAEGNGKKKHATALFSLARIVTALTQSHARGDGPAVLLESALDHYRPLLEDRYDDFRRRLADLESLLRMAVGSTSSQIFLADLSLDPPDGSRDEEAPDPDEFLTLSTIHSAKGLEFRAVFILSVVEGCIPAPYAWGDEEALEEEKRLLYVAITRAQRFLYLCMPRFAGRASLSYGLDEGGPNRWIANLPPDLCEQWELENDNG